MLAAGAALAFSAPAAASTDQAPSRAVVVRPLTFINVQALRFGDILPSNAQGFVRVLPDGSRTATGGVTLYGSTHQEARFAGMGVYNQTVRIRLRPAGTTFINLNRVGGGGTAMRVDQFEIGSTPNTVILTANYQDFNLGSPTGQYNFGIGGQLRVNANQLPGTYTGTFTLELIYQ
jgi:hypothetical protein